MWINTVKFVLYPDINRHKDKALIEFLHYTQSA